MSRSFKKTPIYKESHRGSSTIKSPKRVLSHKVRSKLKDTDILLSGNQYRKIYNRKYFSEFKWYFPLKRALKDYENRTNENYPKYDEWLTKYYPTKKDYLRWWRGQYKNK